LTSAGQVDDLFPLLAFVGVRPFDDPVWFNRLV
jgi:hypothetical protein